MPVDKISSSEQVKAKSSSIVRSAIGWIQDMLGESVQEISDFSALLSAEAATQGQPADVAARTNERSGDKPATIAQKEKSKLGDQSDNSAASAVPLVEKKADKTPALEREKDQDTETEQDNSDELPVDELETVTPEIEATKLESAHKPEEIELPQVIAVPTLGTPKSQPLLTEGEQVEAGSAAIVEAETETAGQWVKEGAVTQESRALTQEEARIAEEVKASQSAAKLESARPAVDAAETLENQLNVMQGQGSTKDGEPRVEAHVVRPEGEKLNPLNPLMAFNPATSSLGFAQAFLNSQINSGAFDNRVESAQRGIDALSQAKSVFSKISEAGSNQSALNGKASDLQLSVNRSVFGTNPNSTDSSQKSESLKNSKPLTRGQTLATLEKVEAVLKKASESKDGTMISLRLDPPSLGNIKVDVTFKEGALHARLSAENAQVLQLLREKAPDLQVILRKLGLDVDRVSVSVNSGDQGAFFDDSGQSGHGNEQKSGKNFRGLADSADAPEAAINLDHWIA